jgi:ADP-ribose pyrophosphatase YjhB (NUDIX family)
MDDVRFIQNNIKFDMRVVGIIKHGDKILLQHRKNLESFSLPGGGCTLLEDSGQAIKREIAEEIGSAVNVQKLSFITEDFFKYADKTIHQIALYYLLFLEENSNMLKQEEFDGI